MQNTNSFKKNVVVQLSDSKEKKCSSNSTEQNKGDKLFQPVGTRED